ncbi:hypothetical protein Psi02_31190 [Planotetraspora silvatica]|uniref:Protein kinase domain-containing protein n=2 Tax=Planotetraspora silvatica TaxID=234614 RepID=A0A8J3UYD7_9ACTN|nr:hypothetical protein Psi02_31190 [Planotetraspora silvatica]
MSRGGRLTAHSAVSTSLALCSDRGLRELVDAAVPLGSGIGGRSALMEVAGTPVFLKRVPLTDSERLPRNTRSTANMFGLPAFCQYGIGGPGFGAWRELAVHTMTTNWVLAGQFQGFPLMYHWRVLPDTEQPLPEELADVERAVAYWGGGPEVRHRIEALRQASASVALFLEYIPQNLHEWLGAQVRAGEEAADRACSLVDKGLEAGVSFMNARGLLHFDAHFERKERDALVRACAEGERPTGIPEAAAAILTRYSSLAVVMADFYRKLQEESRQTPYPLEEIHRVVAACGLSIG